MTRVSFVLTRYSGRGKTSGLDPEEMRAQGQACSTPTTAS
jgi:hypothetical protein